MNIKNRIKNILTAFVLIAVMGSCSEDFLEIAPVGSLSNEVLSNQAGIEKVLIGAYSKLNGINPPDVITTTPVQLVPGLIRSDQALAGLPHPDVLPAMLNTLSPTNNLFDLGFQNTYEAIYRCNQVISLVEAATDLTDEQKDQYKAEARFLRGHFYFMLWTGYQNIPWVDETTDNVRQPNTDESGNYIDISDKILADFEYASSILPESYGGEDIARPNKYAALAYYAKMSVYIGNYIDLGQSVGSGSADSYYGLAKTALNTVMTQGVTSSGEAYGLQEDYQWNYNPDHENSKESVFSVQCVVDDGTTSDMATGNVIMGFWMNNNKITGFFGLAVGQPSQWFVDSFRTDADGLPYLDMYDTNGVSIDGNATDVTTPIDPRLDITVGRIGIPFLDYGDMVADWLFTPFFGSFTQKKWILKKEQISTYTYSTGDITCTAQNMDIIRYSDVLLLAAEVEARVGSLDNATDYVNEVRSRMIDNPDNWVKTSTGDDAANYSIGLYDTFASEDYALDAILFERNLELGFEGSRYFDLVRFGKDVDIMSAYYAKESAAVSFLNGATYTASTPTLMPIPTNAIVGSEENGVATLTQNPGY